jgi:hypothetical protein
VVLEFELEALDLELSETDPALFVKGEANWVVENEGMFNERPFLDACLLNACTFLIYKKLCLPLLHACVTVEKTLMISSHLGIPPKQA